MPSNKPSNRLKAIFFDLMGTCLDWHKSITPVLRDAMTEVAKSENKDPPSDNDVSQLALDWRQGFFDEIHARFEANELPEDIDVTHRRVLDRLLSQPDWDRFASFSLESKDKCIAAWHSQRAWPDVVTGLTQLKQHFDVVVLANGTTRLQIDITKSSGLHFDMLMSSELLGLTKPDPQMYLKAMSLLKREPNECIMVAAHAYDLRAAKKVGMHTAYIQRWTEDPQEDMNIVKEENNIFIDGRTATEDNGGLVELEKLLENADIMDSRQG